MFNPFSDIQPDIQEDPSGSLSWLIGAAHPGRGCLRFMGYDVPDRCPWCQVREGYEYRDAQGKACVGLCVECDDMRERYRKHAQRTEWAAFLAKLNQPG